MILIIRGRPWGARNIKKKGRRERDVDLYMHVVAEHYLPPWSQAQTIRCRTADDAVVMLVAKETPSDSGRQDEEKKIGSVWAIYLS